MGGVGGVRECEEAWSAGGGVKRYGRQEAGRREERPLPGGEGSVTAAGPGREAAA